MHHGANERGGGGGGNWPIRLEDIVMPTINANTWRDYFHKPDITKSRLGSP